MKGDLLICNEDDCDQPRMVSRSGKLLTKCHKHQKEAWARYKTPNPKKGRRNQRRGSSHSSARKVDQRPAPAPVVELPKHLKVVLVDHDRDVVQRFDVPVLSSKKLSDVKNSAKLLDLYRATGHLVVEVGKIETRDHVEEK